MKKLLHTFLAFGLFFSCSENKENDLDKANLNGDVKSVYTASFDAIEKFGEVTKGEKGQIGVSGKLNGRVYDRVIFDDKGNQIERIVYNFTHKYKYDDIGNRIENTSYNIDGEIHWKKKYKYDDKGNEIEEKHYNKNGGLIFTYKYKYDDKGNRIERSGYGWPSFDLTSKTKYKYDDKGNEIEEKNYNFEFLSTTLTKYKYDDKGNEIEEKSYDKKNKLIDKTNYEYKFDDKENWIQQIKFIDDKPAFIIEREIKYYD